MVRCRTELYGRLGLNVFTWAAVKNDVYHVLFLNLLRKMCGEIAGQNFLKRYDIGSCMFNIIDRMRCMEACLSCYEICIRTALITKRANRSYLDGSYSLLLSCAVSCRSCARSLNDSEINSFCVACADGCDDCADFCEKSNDMEECARTCRYCAIECRLNLSNAALMGIYWSRNKFFNLSRILFTEHFLR